MRRRLLGSAILTALGLAGCNAILGLDGDTMIGGASPQGDASPDVNASNDDGGIDASVDARLDAGPTSSSTTRRSGFGSRSAISAARATPTARRTTRGSRP